MAAAKPVPDETLPMLRQDLKILRPTGEPETSERWLIYDPVCHRYIEIDQPTFEILTLWRPGATVSRLLAAVAETFDRNIGKDDVAAFIEFAAKSNLLDSAEAGDWRRLSGEAARQRLMWRQRLLHNYLFFKIPVFRPQNFLVATRPYVEFLFSRSAAATIVTIGILGLYLASRQWDAFLATFHSFLDLDGALAFAVALIAVKSLHELGHAYTAVRLGCHVPTMGVAFMMLTPML